MDVAVKIMLFQNSTQADVTRQLVLREAAVSCSLSHPNLVATYHYEVLQATGFNQSPSGLSISDKSGEGAFKLYLIQVCGVRVSVCSIPPNCGDVVSAGWRCTLQREWPPGTKACMADVPACLPTCLPATARSCAGVP